MSVVQPCPNATDANPHALVDNMHRHCPDREKPCKWVVCGNCKAVVQLTDRRFFTGGRLS